MRKTTFLLAAAAALVLCGTVGAANLSVVTPGLGPETQAPNCNAGCKLEVGLTADTIKAYVVDTTPANEQVYRWGFHVHPNNLTIPDSINHQVFIARADAPMSRELFRVALQFRNSKYRIKAFANQDDTEPLALNKAGQFQIGGGVKSFFDFEWVASSSCGAADGIMRITRLGTTKETTNVVTPCPDTVTVRGVDRVQFGYVRGGDPSITGAYWLDTFSSFRTLAP
ncbi:MAG: hypothetical protein GY719_31860 [bacterium]|nr:hypothetical protein [bacterium]